MDVQLASVLSHLETPGVALSASRAERADIEVAHGVVVGEVDAPWERRQCCPRCRVVRRRRPTSSPILTQWSWRAGGRAEVRANGPYVSEEIGNGSSSATR